LFCSASEMSQTMIPVRTPHTTHIHIHTHTERRS
jgi:hypothetical protein